jgi:hypothetical protein
MVAQRDRMKAVQDSTVFNSQAVALEMLGLACRALLAGAAAAIALALVVLALAAVP